MAVARLAFSMTQCSLTLPARAVQVVFFNCKDLASISVYIYILDADASKSPTLPIICKICIIRIIGSVIISCGGNMSFSEYLQSHVCYRRLVQSMPLVGSPYQLKLLKLYEAGNLPLHHPYARQVRKLEYLTRLFRFHFEHNTSCFNLKCELCFVNGGF